MGFCFFRIIPKIGIQGSFFRVGDFGYLSIDVKDTSSGLLLCPLYLYAGRCSCRKDTAKPSFSRWPLVQQLFDRLRDNAFGQFHVQPQAWRTVKFSIPEPIAEYIGIQGQILGFEVWG